MTSRNSEWGRPCEQCCASVYIPQRNLRRVARSIWFVPIAAWESAQTLELACRERPAPAAKRREHHDVRIAFGDVLAAVTASTRSMPELRSNAASSPVCALTAATIIGLSGHCWQGNLEATSARRCCAAAGPRLTSLSNPNAPIARRRSAAEVAAAPMARMRSNTVPVGGDGGSCRFCPTGRAGAVRIEASSCAGGMPLRTCAAADTTVHRDIRTVPHGRSSTCHSN